MRYEEQPYFPVMSFSMAFISTAGLVWLLCRFRSKIKHYNLLMIVLWFTETSFNTTNRVLRLSRVELPSVFVDATTILDLTTSFAYVVFVTRIMKFLIYIRAIRE